MIAYLKQRYTWVMMFITLSTVATATEGMWLPYMLTNREAEMRQMGMMISAEDIYSINNGSLKDAIVSFGGFCTGEIISDQGLVLTNHHCGYGAIQSHSSVEHNYLENGYWAKSMSDELPNAGLFVRFVKYIEDVTVLVMDGVNDNMSDEEKAARIEQNKEELLASRQAKDNFEYEFKEIYYGNQVILIASVRYNDVRLVGAPPSSIGKYGSDTDNWVWPRHTGDFSMFRIYADVNNNPAEFNEANVPFKPYRSLTISTKGTKPGDFTFVYGFPGRTEEYLPAIAVEQMMHDLNPMKIAIRDIKLRVMKSFMVEDEAIDIQYASKYASTANAWKKWIGQVQGIEKTYGLDSIRRAEARFQYELAKDNQLWNKYSHLLPNMEAVYHTALPVMKQRDQFIEIAYSGIDAFKFNWTIKGWVELALAGDTAKVEASVEKVKQAFEGFYKDFNTSVDSTVAFELLNHWIQTAEVLPEFLASVDGQLSVAEMYNSDIYVRPEQREAVMNMLDTDPVALGLMMAESELYKNTMSAFKFYLEDVAPAYRSMAGEMDALQKEYMAAQMEVGDMSQIYPDANSTMRITYGKVDGFKPQDAVEYRTHTYLDGVIAKYVPGDYEFDLPERVIELYEAKEYGAYADENGKLPVCFIASNHTSGGNSGSPALNAKGELIGLNFDRVWEGTMSDVYFDPSICRNIMVDIRYVLWVVDVYADADRLIEEMNIISE